MAQKTLSYSRAIPLPFDGTQLLDDFDFFSLQNGQTKITAAKSDFGGGGNATSIKAGNTSLFTTPTNGANVAVSSQGGAGKITLSAAAPVAANNGSKLLLIGLGLVAVGGIIFFVRR